MRPKRVNVKIAIPFVGEISGEWEPDDAERRAAWELYVELATRISVVPLHAGEGSVREALTSMYSLFATIRDILKRYGPDVASAGGPDRVSFGVLAVTVLNNALRPTLSKWHPRLAVWESTLVPGRPLIDHENAWPEIDALRADLEALRLVLRQMADVLGDVAGAADLIRVSETVPLPMAKRPEPRGQADQ
ncbi:hypothetical protein [Streptomyces prunicolor]|uniref:hypothetical protein n=1 Tax=Streptomyces prunicolor TaxID=67348 RepID=UPI00343C737B